MSFSRSRSLIALLFALPAVACGYGSNRHHDYYDDAYEPGSGGTSSQDIEQAAHRYFMLLDEVEAQLKGRFSKDDFQVILNAECQPTWEWDPRLSVAKMVADDNGIYRLNQLAADSFMRQLLEKLMALNPLENAVLVDACERVWRGYDNPLL